MAIDTRMKRFSMLNMATPVIYPALFEADGSVDADDRAFLLHLYGGNPLNAPFALAFKRIGVLVAGVSSGSTTIDRADATGPGVLTLRQNDANIPLDFVLIDSSLTRHNLAGASVTFSMTKMIGGTPKVDKTAMDVIGSAGLGQARLTPQPSHLEAAGDYFGEIEVTFAAGYTLTFPERGYIPIRIRRQVA